MYPWTRVRLGGRRTSQLASSRPAVLIAAWLLSPAALLAPSSPTWLVLSVLLPTCLPRVCLSTRCWSCLLVV